MRLTHTRVTLAGICLVLAGTPLIAQQPSPGTPAPGGRRAMAPMAGMSMMDCPMMSAMTDGPAAALRAGSALHLSGEQRTKLEQLQRQVDAASKPSMDSMQAIHKELTALGRQPTFDERAARATLDRMGRIHTEMGVAMLRAAHEVSTILTPAQRDSLAAISKRHMPMHEMPMHEMPTHEMPKHETPAHPMSGGAPPKH
jgi:Spy/CpxP family protein refolding chaperone